MTRFALDVGQRRRAGLHVPPATVDPAAPLLVALHGTTQTGAALRRFSGRTLDGLAGSAGADLVYLDGHRRAWNDGRRSAFSAARREEVDDVGFVRAVAERFGRPVIAIGYSNGGQLVHRLLRETSGLLRAAVIVAAGLPVEEDFAFGSAPVDRVPVLLIHGTADPVVPYGGGETRLLGLPRGAVRSARTTAEAYADGSEPTSTTFDGHDRLDWPGVRLVSQHGTGHVVPNRVTRPPFVGPSHRDLDTGAETGDFLGLAGH